MQVLADGRWPSSAGRMVTDGIGWNPSSDAGRDGDPETIKKCCLDRNFVIVKLWTIDISILKKTWNEQNLKVLEGFN